MFEIFGYCRQGQATGDLLDPVTIGQRLRHRLRLDDPPGDESNERGRHRLNGFPVDPVVCPKEGRSAVADDCVGGGSKEGTGFLG